MTSLENSLPALATLLESRLAIVGLLAASLEASQPALLRKDVESIARGAAHQAELCRQWSLLEAELRAEAERRRGLLPAAHENFSGESSARLDEEWRALGTRIRYLTRVHYSLLRHMERSLGILKRVVDSCAATYSAPSYSAPSYGAQSCGAPRYGAPGSAGAGPRMRAGE
jgi:hypothetical protein